MLNLVTPGYAQESHEGDAPAVSGTEQHAPAEHGAFPPFDPTTFGSQLVWLAITFCALLYLMTKVTLPRIGGILEARSNRVAGDLAEAGRLKEETDAAIAAYEQALAEARQNAHGIAQKARDDAKAEIDADRGRIESELQSKLEAAEKRIGEVKSRALSEVDAIAQDAAGAMVEVLIGGDADKSEVAGAVAAAMAERA